jgi:hypothetical protein
LDYVKYRSRNKRSSVPVHVEAQALFNMAQYFISMVVDEFLDSAASSGMEPSECGIPKEEMKRLLREYVFSRAGSMFHGELERSMAHDIIGGLVDDGYVVERLAQRDLEAIVIDM